MSGSKNKQRRKRDRQDSFDLGNNKMEEAEVLRRKQSRTAVIVLIIVAVVGAVAFFLNSNLFYRNMTAFHAEGTRFSIAEMNYYVSMANFDRETAFDMVQESALLHRRAVEEGLETLPELQEQVEATMEWVREATSATPEVGSVNAFISLQFGRGMNQRLLRRQLEFDALARSYIAHFMERASESFSEADLEAFYTEHRDDFDRVHYRVYAIEFVPDEIFEVMEEPEDNLVTHTEAMDMANEIRAAADEEEFLGLVQNALFLTGNWFTDPDGSTWRNATPTTIANDPNRAAYSDWLLNAARRTGDTTVVTGGDAVFVLYFVGTDENRYHAANVRHILITPDQSALFEEDGFTPRELDEDERETITEAAHAAAEVLAANVLAQWQAAGSTVDAFIELVQEYSEDSWEANTSPGLYEDIDFQTPFVSEFLDWAMDPSRRVGDFEIVETQFGFHIMLFDSHDELTLRHRHASDTMAFEEYEAWLEAALESQTTRTTMFTRLVIGQ